MTLWGGTAGRKEGGEEEGSCTKDGKNLIDAQLAKSEESCLLLASLKYRLEMHFKVGGTLYGVCLCACDFMWTRFREFTHNMHKRLCDQNPAEEANYVPAAAQKWKCAEDMSPPSFTYNGFYPPPPPPHHLPHGSPPLLLPCCCHSDSSGTDSKQLTDKTPHFIFGY